LVDSQYVDTDHPLFSDCGLCAGAVHGLYGPSELGYFLLFFFSFFCILDYTFLDEVV